MLFHSRCSASGGLRFSSAIWLRVRPVSGQAGLQHSFMSWWASARGAAACAAVLPPRAQVQLSRLAQPQGSGTASWSDAFCR